MLGITSSCSSFLRFPLYNVILNPPVEMSLEDCISYINDDELVEMTPKAIRLRKYIT